MPTNLVGLEAHYSRYLSIGIDDGAVKTLDRRFGESGPCVSAVHLNRPDALEVCGIHDLELRIIQHRDQGFTPPAPLHFHEDPQKSTNTIL